MNKAKELKILIKQSNSLFFKKLLLFSSSKYYLRGNHPFFVSFIYLFLSKILLLMEQRKEQCI